MKATGIVRRVDQLGRIVIPKELRDVLDIAHNDCLEIFTEGSNIIFKKYSPACVFCGEYNKIEQFKGKNICSKCIKELR